MNGSAPHHDIVVVGASAGGIEALGEFVAGLPADLPAAVFIVQHIRPDYSTRLPEMLSRRGPLRATHALHGEPIVPGRIYLAPPDNHLTVRPGFVQVVRGPRENSQRPAVDALFRTAAIAYGPRVIGVVLTGHLDCGTAGLLSVKARGGKAIVQDPADAAARSMPSSALLHVDVDHVAPLREIPELVTELVHQPAPPWPAHLPASIAQLEGNEPGAPAEIVCPTCQGKLTETNVNGFPSFRCHVGHSFSMESVAAEQAEEVERALWSAVRALEESATLAERLAATSTDRDLRERFAEKKYVQRLNADLIRRILLSGGVLDRTDSSAAGEAGETAAQAESGEPA